MILLGDGEPAAAKRRLLERAGARIVGEEDAATLAIVANGDEAAVARLKARGVLVNVVDRPELCDFTLPAIVDRDPVLIAIGTGGASAGLAKALRQRLERLLPSRLGAVAATLQGARDAIRLRWPTADERRRAIDAALDEGGPLDPFGPADPAAVERWMATDAGAAGRMLVPICLRSADPDDLSLRDARLLGCADRLYHRRDMPAPILDRARVDAVRVACDAPPADPGPGLSLDLGWDRP